MDTEKQNIHIHDVVQDLVMAVSTCDARMSCLTHASHERFSDCPLTHFMMQIPPSMNDVVIDTLVSESMVANLHKI